jgi:hypothetical protein
MRASLHMHKKQTAKHAASAKARMNQLQVSRALSTKAVVRTVAPQLDVLMHV